jgi:ABC-type sulfate/molybdate transport systems ATPase subunit
VRLEEVRLRRGGRTILDRVDLELPRGEIRFLVGASGAGKTSLLRLVAGLERPQTGRIIIGDEVVTEADQILVAPHRRRVAMAFQDGALWDAMTVERHLRFGMPRRNGDAAARIDEVLELVGLSDRRQERPSHFSGGERQRVGLARALAHEPEVLLLDEPLAHIDLSAQLAMARTLADWISQHGITTLWVTHRPGEVAFVPGGLFLLEGGRIAETLTRDAVPSWLRRH